jgi:hypothetical protein
MNRLDHLLQNGCDGSGLNLSIDLNGIPLSVFQ